MVGQLPFISKQSIRLALDGMLYGTSASDTSSLEHLTIVDRFLQERQIPQVEERRQFAVRSLLNELTTQNLESQRNNFGLVPRDESDSLAAAYAATALDARQQSAELVGWGILYYRYVRADLNITLADYGRVVHIDERTLRRYQSHAIARLRDCLASAEAATRREHRHLRLYAAVHGGLTSPVMGRSEILRVTRELLLESYPRHLQITGPRGIGKTTFVKLLLHELIEADEVDQLFWFDEPDNAVDVLKYLEQTILQDIPIGLREHLLQNRLGIVLDGLHKLAQIPTDLERLLNELGDATVYLINVVYVRITPECKHIVLPPLDRAEVADIVRHQRVAYMSEDEMAGYADILWGRTGGNPLAVKLLVNNLNNLAVDQPVGTGDGIIKNIFLASYEALDIEARHILLMFVLLSARPLKIADVEQIWPHHMIEDDQLIELISCGLIGAQSGGQYVLGDGVRSLVQEISEENTGVALLITELMDDLDYRIRGNTDACLEVVENILQRHWPELAPERESSWIDITCERGVRAGHYALWESIISKNMSQPENMSYPSSIAYAICQRRMSQWFEAENNLKHLIQHAGYEGEFVWQGRGLLEYSHLLRQKGLYEQALAVLSRVETLAERLGIPALADEIALEHARIALDAGMYHEALMFLKDKETSNARTLSLLSETYACLQNFDQARKYGDEAIRHLEEGTSDVGRLYANLGRVYLLGQGDANMAQKYLSAAIVVLEKGEDHFAAARAKSNLAVVLMNMEKDYHDARQLLVEAEGVQMQNKDQVGLAHTRHNLSELDRLIVDVHRDRNTMDVDLN